MIGRLRRTSSTSSALGLVGATGSSIGCRLGALGAGSLASPEQAISNRTRTAIEEARTGPVYSAPAARASRMRPRDLDARSDFQPQRAQRAQRSTAMRRALEHLPGTFFFASFALFAV
jgi:hypothetical protein